MAQTPPVRQHATPEPIAYGQHQQELLEALDRLAAYQAGYRAKVAAGEPSIAIARQMRTDVGRVVEETVAMVTLRDTAQMGTWAA
jgi:hypothetical protein